jgi:uncharacterized protein
MIPFRLINPLIRTREFNGLCALGIMTKAPEAGKVKTRLTPPLSPEEAAAINECFLRDLADAINEAARTSAAAGVAIYTPIGKETAYNKILPNPFMLVPQRGDAFGDRLIHGAEDLLAAGFGAVCLINSDSPTVPAANFAEAAIELSKPGERIVIGPSDDGGYYLIGLKVMRSLLFERIDWSTERVLTQTLERAQEIAVPVHQLPTGYDVDDGATLRRLCDELLGNEAPSAVAPNTRQFLKQLVKGEGRERIWPRD